MQEVSKHQQEIDGWIALACIVVSTFHTNAAAANVPRDWTCFWKAADEVREAVESRSKSHDEHSEGKVSQLRCIFGSGKVCKWED